MVFGGQTTEALFPALSKPLHPFLRSSTASWSPRCSSFPMAVVVIDGQCAPLFPYELRWRCDALRAVLLPYPTKQTCILKSSLCLGSHCSRDVFTPIQPLSKCLRRRAGERFSISCKKSDTCSSILFAYLRSVASAIVCPIVGSWQNAIVATRMACSRVSFFSLAFSGPASANDHARS